MKLAFDLDGVLANFNPSYAKRLVKITGKNKFPENFTIPCWDWDKFYGYTQAEIGDAWESILDDGLFWLKLPALAPPEVFTRINVLTAKHDVYFITNRRGVDCRRQSEAWLYDKGINYPAVIVSGNKKPVLQALGIEAFCDDRLETMNELADLKREFFYLIDAPYNQANRSPHLKVASTAKDFLEKVGLW